MDGDVAERGPRADFDGLLTRLRAGPGVEIVVDLAELGVEIQPGCDALANPDVDPSHRRVSDHGSAFHVAQADVPVGRLGNDSRVRMIDVDGTVRGDHPKVSRDVTDPGAAVGPFDLSRSFDRSDPHGTRPGDDLRMAARPVHRDVAGTGGE